MANSKDVRVTVFYSQRLHNWTHKHENGPMVAQHRPALETPSLPSIVVVAAQIRANAKFLDCLAGLQPSEQLRRSSTTLCLMRINTE